MSSFLLLYGRIITIEILSRRSAIIMSEFVAGDMEMPFS